MDKIIAESLGRNSIVKLDGDDMPHLVDSVRFTTPTTVEVKFSSGRIVTFDSDAVLDGRY